MEITKQHLYDIIDMVDAKELSLLYHLVCKFIPEDIPYPDEIDAIKKGRAEIARGEYVSIEDVDWD